MSEKIHENYGNTEEDFRGVNSWTLMALLDDDYRRRLSQEDVAHIEKELARRKDEGEVESDDDGGGMAIDLVKHGFGINRNGQILYPNDGVREFIRNGYKGKMPHRETLKERAQKVVAGAKNDATLINSEKRKSPSVNDIASAVIKSNKQPSASVHLQIRTDINDSDKVAIEREETYLAKRFEASEQNKSLLVRASEPLVLQVLGSSESDNGLLRTCFSRAKRATKYDDYVHSTDLIYEFESPAGDQVGKRKLITLSVDVTTAETDKKNKGVAEKFDESGYHKEVDIPWTQEITFCGWKKDARTVKNAPHFIIGLSEDTIEEIAKSMHVNENGILESGQVSRDVEFMVASEFWEQALMQLAFFPKGLHDEHRKKLLQVKKVMQDKLAGLLKLDESYEWDGFIREYLNKANQLIKKDRVYKRTIDEAHDIKDKHRQLFSNAS